MLHRFLFGLNALALAFVVILALGGPVQAQSLNELRASGAVGERFDGYLVARDDSAKAFVKQVNAKRRKVYQKRAKAQGAPADQVGRVYAEKIFKDAPKGTWLQKPNKKWMQK